ncbi:MAG: hypothetical protein D3906_08095 [Candidatus Electrothrix sp. AUS1_2]|nr:hypothetical protein [Candidatus Electrothrix sp. AUS1_2]
MTKISLNHKIVITINGEAIAEPTVRETVSDGIIRIPVDDERAAIRLAKSLTIQNKNSEPSSEENLQ